MDNIDYSQWFPNSEYRYVSENGTHIWEIYLSGKDGVLVTSGGEFEGRVFGSPETSTFDVCILKDGEYIISDSIEERRYFDEVLDFIEENRPE